MKLLLLNNPCRFRGGQSSVEKLIPEQAGTPGPPRQRPSRQAGGRARRQRHQAAQLSSVERWRAAAAGPLRSVGHVHGGAELPRLHLHVPPRVSHQGAHATGPMLCLPSACPDRQRLHIERPGADLVRRRLPAGTATLLSGVSRSDRKSTRLNSSHVRISYAVFCLKKKKKKETKQKIERKNREIA